jgi:hypothetical protein
VGWDEGLVALQWSSEELARHGAGRVTFAVKGIRRSDDRPAAIRWDAQRGWSGDPRTMHDLVRFYVENMTVSAGPAGPAIPNDPCDGFAASLVALALLRDPWLTQGELPTMPTELKAAAAPARGTLRGPG